MARKALPHRMCDQRGPVDEVILKIAAGNPQGRLSAKGAFGYFSRHRKVTRSAMEWHRNPPWMASQKNKLERQARRTRKEDKQAQQIRRTSQSNKPKEQKEQSTSKFKYN